MRLIAIILLAIGLYQLIGGPVRFPPWKSVKAISKLTGKKVSFKETIEVPIARFLEPHIRLSPYRKDRLKTELSAAGRRETPEFHTAVAIVNAGTFFFAGLAVLPVLPIGTAVLAAYSVFKYFNDRKVTDSDERRERIEAETPRFTSYIVQCMAHRPDTPSMIHGYRRIAGEDLGSELDMLYADMKTKNHEAALIDFESRIDSPLVSDLVRGIIGFEHGEDMQAYLLNVEARMNEHEIAALEKEAAARPDKLGPASWLLFISIMCLYMAVLGVQLFTSIKAFS